ncbi:MAG TPA: hypothetical protein VGG53_06730, partial [Mycobacterium sp.]
MTATDSGRAIPVPFAQVVKRTFLGQPLVSAKLQSERLSTPVALGAVAPDPISSTCYGPEQVLLELVPAAGMAAFALLLPITERNKHPDTHVTMLMPRRAYGPLGLVLHDRTADKIAEAVSRTPGSAAT